MKPSDVIRGLLDPSPHFVCENLRDHGSSQKYRVPVTHRPLPHFNHDAFDPDAGAKAMAALPDLPSVQQLHAILENYEGIGLWVARRLHDNPSSIEPGTVDAQAAAGSLLIFPAAEWETLRTEFADWQFDGLEAAFEGLPYSFDDIIPFAGVNFSPDRWFIVLRGPMAGNVCWWTHDGDSVMHEPWAVDVTAWADRVFADAPGVFGGVIRFAAADSPDSAPDGAELFPVEYRREVSDRP